MSKSKKKSSRRSKSSEWTAETIPPNNDSGGVNSHTTKAAPARNNHQHGAVTGTSTNHDGDGEGPHDAVSPHEAITLQNDSSSNVETAGSFSSKRKGISTTCNDEESEVAQTQCKRPKAGNSNASAGSKSAKVDVFFEQHNAQEEDDTSVDINDLKEKSDDEEAGEGTENWKLIAVIAEKDLGKKKPKKCQDEGCLSTACSVWVSNLEPDKEWYGCIDCMET